MLRITYYLTVMLMPMTKFIKLMTKAEQATTRKKARKILKKVKKLASARQELPCSLELSNDCDN